MKSIKHVMVTGSNGYIGSMLTTLLKKEGYNVIGLDTGYFDDPVCQFKNNQASFHLIKKDIRNINEEDLKDIDAVCHLAALSNDPMGELNPELTIEINLKASQRLAEFAKKCGVQRFLFSSSCSLYGTLGDKAITEDTPVAPVTTYAVSKVEFEKSLLRLADKNFCPIILRNATVYGSADKLRLDLVLNNLAAGAFVTGEIKILSDGTPWRPIVHVEDTARLFIAFLEAPTERVYSQIINCGQNNENFQIKDLANAVSETFGSMRVSFAEKPDRDSRTYRVHFDKLKEILPDFKFKWTLKKAAQELLEDFQAQGLPNDVLKKRDFIRLRQLEHLIKNNKVDRALFWKT